MWHRLTVAIRLPLVSLATACTAVTSVHSPAEFIAAKSPGMVWVTKSDNTILPLESPIVMADTLAGFVKGDYVEMPMSTVQAVRVRHAAGGRTALLVGGVAVVAAGVLFATFHHTAATGDPCAVDNCEGSN